MRIVATLAIVMLHVCSTISEHTDSFVISDQQLSVLQEILSLQRWAVPCFLMMSGVLLFDRAKNITLKNVFLYSRRILLALFLFGTFYAFVGLVLSAKAMNVSMVFQAFWAVVENKSWGHLWYLYTYLGAILIIPVFKAFTDRCDARELWYIVGTLFVFVCIIPTVNELFEVSIAFKLPVTCYSVFYMLLGKALNDGLPRWLRRMPVAITVMLVYAVVCYAAICTDRRTTLLFDMNFSPLVVCYAASIFVFFQNIDWKITENVWRLDRLCFGVYLIHPVFIHFAYKFIKITPVQFSHTGGATVLFWAAFSALSFLASFILSKITIIKKYIL